MTKHLPELYRDRKSWPDSILVIVEQREGKLNRVSWETLTAGQALAAETGWTLEAAVAGSGVTTRQRSRRQEGRESLRHRVSETRSVHARRVHRGAEASSSHPCSPGSCSCRTPIRCAISCPSLRRRWNAPPSATALDTRKKATNCCSPARCSRANSPPTSASPACALVCYLPERRISRRQSRGRRQPRARRDRQCRNR